jgi:D-amino-acid oxidase
MPSICVVGAGVSGLTTAIELIERGNQVAVLACGTRQSTTSSAAAAFWYPFWTGQQPDHSWYRPIWAWDSFLSLERFVDEPDAGVTRCELFEYFDEQMEPEAVRAVIEGMWWRVMRQTKFATLSKTQVADKSFGTRRFQSGCRFQTLVVNMSCYLPYLEKRLVAGGGNIDKQFVEPADMVRLGGQYDFVVNCSGLGARRLVDDRKLIPVEGVVVRSAPVESVRSVTLLHTGPHFSEQPVYIVPRGGPAPDVVLGGTLTKVGGVPAPVHFDWSRLSEADPRIRSDVETILGACHEIEPSLKFSQPVGVSVGYRPVRLFSGSFGDRTEPVRLEPECSGPLAGKLIHNYGHGGGGVTLSWGCAREAIRWIEWLS